LDLDTNQIAYLILIGLLAGCSGGLLGIGGSVVMIPGLVIVLGQQHQHLYQAAAMIVNFFVVSPAVVQYRRAGAVIQRVVTWTAPSAVIGAIAGTYASELKLFRGPGQGYLQLLFAAFLFYTLVYNLLRLRSRKRLPPLDDEAVERLSIPVMAGLIGFPSGLLGGLLGIGGGLIALPTQQILLRLPLPNAVANSAVTILFSSIVGAVVKNGALKSHGYSWTQAMQIVLWLIPPAILASWYMADKVNKLPVRVIRIAFSILLLYGCIKLIQAGISHIYGVA
jgi:uncharacterized membrane protein YfcA